MNKNINKKRYEFWEWYFTEFAYDCRNRFKEGPLPFVNARESAYSQILFSLISAVDAILTPTLVCYIEDNKKPGLSIYNDLFSGNYQRTFELLEKFHSPTFFNVINRYRRFKAHFYTLTDRIFNDWEEIKKSFKIEDNEVLVNIKLMCGDEHFYGGQTSLFRFGTGTKGFIYKPLGIGLDMLMQELKLLIYKDTKNVIISKTEKRNGIEGGYGYIGLFEYIGEARDLMQAKNLYKDFGKLLAWGKFFKIADGHCDNIIVSDEGVQWIDLETAFLFTQDSVYDVHPLEETGLIYDAKHENTFIGIVTGIQGGSIPRLALTSPTVYNDGTDEMYIRYFRTFTPTDCYNRFLCKGKECKPEDFVEEITKGYVESIKKLYSERDNIIKHIKSFLAVNQVRCRYLVQTTASYARFIGLLNHILGIKNNGILSKIRSERSITFIGKEKTIQNFMLENEIIDMVNGVIPYFYRTNKSCKLYHASGASRDDFFSTSLLQDIESHIMSIKVDCDTLKYDCEFISKALKSTAGINNFESFKKRFNFTVYDFNKSI